MAYGTSYDKLCTLNVYLHCAPYWELNVYTKDPPSYGQDGRIPGAKCSVYYDVLTAASGMMFAALIMPT